MAAFKIPERLQAKFAARYGRPSFAGSVTKKNRAISTATSKVAAKQFGRKPTGKKVTKKVTKKSAKKSAKKSKAGGRTGKRGPGDG